MRVLTRIANRALKAKAWSGARRWVSATDRTAETQESLLIEIVRKNAETAFGREHSFTSIGGVADYQERVPIRDYDAFVPYVEAIAAGHDGILTADRVTRLLPTGGSTGGTKLIPHTRSLSAAFQRGIDPWLHSLFTRWPGVMDGRAYWQVTPPTSASRGEAGLTGFAEDSQYLSSAARILTQQVLAVPDSVGHLRSVDNFKYVTLRYLLACRDLTIISVWSPTFLEALLGSMDRWHESLLRDIHDGTLKTPDEVPEDRLQPFAGCRVPRPKRARELERCLQSKARRLAQVWPELRVISCWSDASASGPAQRLMGRFPDAVLQPKGLIATEAIITFPWRSAGQALAVTSHFFEFVDGNGRARLAHELERGHTYSVIVTNQGGLYRYRLRDLVRVTGSVGECPMLEFLGKEGLIVDLVGEKLHEAFVRAAVDQCCVDLSIRPSFALVAPSGPSPHAHGYTLFIQCDDLPERDNGIRRRLAQRLDAALQRNSQYRYARELGQLGQIEVATIDREIDAAGGFERHCRSKGQRLGRIKPVALHSASDWSAAFNSMPPSAGPANQRTPPMNEVDSPLYSVTRGRESQKTPILLMHGFTGSSEVWEGDILDRLSEDRRAITVDLPGHGRSLISSDPTRIDFSAVVELLVETLDAHEIPVADWIGYSMGGRIALAAAIQRPNRVRRLVLEGASPGLETEPERARRRADDEALADRIEELGIDWFVDYWMALPLLESQRTLGSNAWAEARARRLRNDPQHLAAALRALGAGSQPSLWSDLSKIGQDLLLLTGESDEKYRRLAERIADSSPRAAHVCVPGAGHAVHVEAPDVWLEAVLRFLDAELPG